MTLTFTKTKVLNYCIVSKPNFSLKLKLSHQANWRCSLVLNSV